MAQRWPGSWPNTRSIPAPSSTRCMIYLSTRSAQTRPCARGSDLPGRRIVYTNGTAHYAERVIAARGLSGLFDAVYGVEHANYAPKPRRAAFEAVFEADGFDPLRGAMFEDEARNLEIPHQMGLRTVHVASKPDTAGHIHHHTDDLSGFLAKLL